MWQNDSGEAAIWEVNGTTVVAAASLGNPGPSWHVKGTGDFNGDSFSDVLWQNDKAAIRKITSGNRLKRRRPD
jgi:hypothetical protein